MKQINNVVIEGRVKKDISVIEDDTFTTVTFNIKNENTEECKEDKDIKTYCCVDIPIKITCLKGAYKFIKHLFVEGNKICAEGSLQVEHESGQIYVLADHFKYDTPFMED